MYSIVAALNYQSIPSNPERISNLKPFISGYNWNDIEFPAGHKDYFAFEKNNTGITLNILYIPHNTFEIRPCYISKHHKTRNIQANLLMIIDGKKNLALSCNKKCTCHVINYVKLLLVIMVTFLV